MPSRLTMHEIVMPGADELSVHVGVPSDWVTRMVEEPPSFLAHMPEETAGPFGDNLIVGVERLDASAPKELDELQGLAYVQAFSSVPDFYAIDDRSLDIAGEPGWFRASLQSAPTGITAVNRQIFTRRGDVLVTLSLTTMGLRDREATELFEDLVDTFNISERTS